MLAETGEAGRTRARAGFSKDRMWTLSHNLWEATAGFSAKMKQHQAWIVQRLLQLQCGDGLE